MAKQHNHITYTRLAAEASRVNMKKCKWSYSTPNNMMQFLRTSCCDSKCQAKRLILSAPPTSAPDIIILRQQPVDPVTEVNPLEGILNTGAGLDSSK